MTNGARPERLNSPAIADDVWQLIQRCWKHDASERPIMQQIFDTVAPFTQYPGQKRPTIQQTAPSSPASATATSLSGVFPSLLASLSKVLYVLLSINALRLIKASQRHAVVQWLTRLPLILHVNCWIYLSIPPLPLNLVLQTLSYCLSFSSMYVLFSFSFQLVYAEFTPLDTPR